MTREEKSKAHKKAWREANKDKKKAYDKEYRLANKDRLKAQRKEYRLANKENIKAYYIANKEKISAMNKGYYLANKHKPLVYLLPKCNWVGTTECISSRIQNHKNVGRNTDNYKILKRFDNRADALELERKMHDLGYKGRHRTNLYK